ncbi:MAG: ABC transporter permease [Gammaproteobacteria bacterium]|nr:ABC transporter permease [Gammaproteobacteria bacterium]
MKSGQWVAYCTLVKKEIQRFMRNWRQRFAPAAISAILYLAVFGQIMGRKIGKIAGIPYDQFILPGLVVFYSMTSAYMNTCFSFFLARHYKIINRMLVSPLPNYLIVLGYFTASAVRSIMTAILILIIGAFFSPPLLYHPLLLLLSLLFIAVTFSAIGMITAMVMSEMLQIHIIYSFLIMPLAYLGGIFYSIHLLPQMGKMASLLNPMSYMVSIVRYSIIGVGDIPTVAALTVVVAIMLLLYGLCTVLFYRGLGIRQ